MRLRLVSSSGESKHCCQPKRVLVFLVVVCFVFVLLVSRTFNSRTRWGGFLLKGSTTSAVSGMIPSSTSIDGPVSLQPDTGRDQEVSSVVGSHTTETQSQNGDPVDLDLHRDLTVNFDPHGNDTLVVLHTQKTGGTEFSRHLVTLQRDGKNLCLLEQGGHKDSTVRRAGRGRRKRRKVRKNGKRGVKKCRTLCPRDPANPDAEQWLIAAKTVRWVCGLHATYSEYKHCIPSLDTPNINPHRRFHYSILLRHPVMRYLSEYLHMQRNATWAAALHMCNGKPAVLAQMPPCYPGYYSGKPWLNLTLSGFVACDSNWANNRQTMMLADLEAVHCFNMSAMSLEEREKRLLETAKKNIRGFSFLGLTEYMVETCHLFEKTFSMTFGILPEPYMSLSEFRSGPLLVNLQHNPELYKAVMRRNHLDMQLYEFALDLFAERADKAGIPVNRQFVSQQVEALMENPGLLDSVIGKRTNQNYKVS